MEVKATNQTSRPVLRRSITPHLADRERLHTPVFTYTWGRGDLGQLGLRVEDNRSCPSLVDDLVGKDVVLAAGSEYHTAFLTDDGELYTNGSNEHGQLGIKSREPALAPVRVATLDTHAITHVACGQGHTLAVTDQGLLASWGSSESGQLGHQEAGDASDLLQPRIVRGLRDVRFVRVACGASHSLACTGGGDVYSFGQGLFGALGHGDEKNQAAPLLIQGLWGLAVVQIGCGENHSAAITVDGQIFTWGRGKYGQLGHGRMATEYRPARIPGLSAEGVTVVACGGDHTLAITNSGQLFSWGRGYWGQTGHGFTENVIVPKRVIALAEATVVYVTGGSRHSLAVTERGVLYGWGDGEQGQLGSLPAECRGTVLEPMRLNCFPQGKQMLFVVAGGDHNIAVFKHKEQSISEQDAVEEGRTQSGEDVAVRSGRESESGSGQGDRADEGAGPKVDGEEWTVSISHVEDGTDGLLRREQGMEGATTPDTAMSEAERLGVETRGSRTIISTQGDDVTGQGDAPMVPDAVSSGRRHEAGVAASSSMDVDAPPLPSKHHPGATPSSPNTLIQPTTSPKSAQHLAPSDALWSARCLIASSASPPVQDRHGAGLQPLQLPPLLALVQEAKSSQNHRPALLHAIEDIFSSPGLLMLGFEERVPDDETRAAVSPTGGEAGGTSTMGASTGGGKPELRLDVNGVKEVYQLILELYSPEVLAKLGGAVMHLLENMKANMLAVPHVRWSKVPLILLQSQLIGEKGLGDHITAALVSVFSRVAEHVRELYLHWLRSYPKDIFGGRFIRGLYRFIANRHLARTEPPEEDVGLAVRVLDLLHRANENDCMVPYTAFYSAAISEQALLKEEYIRWMQSLRQFTDKDVTRVPLLSFCQVPFVLNAEAKSKILHIEARAKQQHEIQNSHFQFLFTGQMHPFLVLQVRRDSLIQDTVQQLTAHHPADFKKPLKVIFSGEAGVDEGGLMKEFFQLAVRDLFNVGYGMFTYNEETRTFWFNPNSIESELEFQLVGIVLGLAIYNGVILDVHFPKVVYKKLMTLPTTLEDLKEVQPEVGRSLQQLLDYDGDVEEAFSLTFQIEYDYFGTIRSHNLMSNGDKEPVTSANREKYVELYTVYILEQSIHQPFEAFQRGFKQVCDGPALTLFRFEELELLICGLPHFDFEALQRVAIYEGGFTADSPVVKWFWELVHAMSLDEKKKLLSFTTGCDRAPIGGLSALRFVIQRMGPDMERLPTSHTCFNILLIPEYSTKVKLNRKLYLAIKNSTGFGLQ